MANKAILYSFWKSSCSWRVRLALRFKHIDYECVAINLFENEHKTDKYIKISPMSQVPALKIDNHTLYQSLPICEYLEETRKDIGLPLFYGNDNLSKYKIRAFCETINAFIQPMQQNSVLQSTNDIFMKELDENEQNKRKLNWARFYIDKGLNTLETIIINEGKNNTKYCFGDDVSFADIFLVPQMYNAQIVYNMDIAQYPRLNGIYNELMDLKEFAESQPNQQTDYPSTAT